MMSRNWSRIAIEDYLVNFQTDRYSVPFTLIGKTVGLERRGDAIVIHCRGDPVATHPVLIGRHQPAIAPGHGPGAVARNGRRICASPAPSRSEPCPDCQGSSNSPHLGPPKIPHPPHRRRSGHERVSGRHPGHDRELGPLGRGICDGRVASGGKSFIECIRQKGSSVLQHWRDRRGAQSSDPNRCPNLVHHPAPVDSPRERAI